MEVGTIIATQEDPSTSSFTFLLKEEVRKGEFVGVNTHQGEAYAFVTELFRTNRYFTHPDTVRGFGSGDTLTSAFPTRRWEYTLAKAKFVGVFDGKNLDRVLVPPSPGDKVWRVLDEKLSDLLGFDVGGVELGLLRNHGIPAKFNLTRLFQKHVAILAMSGAGKSNCAKVVVEELVSRPSESGRPAVVVVDVHGEYLSLAEEFPEQVEIVDGRMMRIGVSHLSSERFREFVPEMSGVQARELKCALASLKANSGAGFDFRDIVEELKGLDGISKNSKQALIGWLHDLESLRIFDRFDYPKWGKITVPGRAVIMNLSEITSLRKKQLLLTHAMRSLFYNRRIGRVPPIILFLEEAHTFAPTESAVSKRIVERVAREGRKFCFSLVVISQRPVRLSTTLLSQAGSNIILRVSNPYDLEHLKHSSEAITSEVAGMISSLPVGEALVVGEAVNHPVFVKIRKSNSKVSTSVSLEEGAREFERLQREGLHLRGASKVVAVNSNVVSEAT